MSNGSSSQSQQNSYPFVNFLQQRNRSIRRRKMDSPIPSFLNLNSVKQDIIDTCVANADLTYSVSMSTINTGDSINYNYYDSILTPGGIIYGIPLYPTSILKLDTNTDTVSRINLGAEKRFDSATLSPDMKYLYLSPCGDSAVYKLELKTNALHRVCSVTGSGNYKYYSCITSSNQKIYMASNSGLGILEINPANDSCNVYENGTSTIPSFPTSDGYNRIYRLFLDMNGNVMFPNGNTVFKLNVTTKAYTYIYQTYYFTEYNIGPDGDYYGLGFYSNGVNYATKTSSNFGTFLTNIPVQTGTIRLNSLSCLAPNGRIYYSQNDIRNSTPCFSVGLDSSVIAEQTLPYGVHSLVLAPNGSIYCMPAEGNQIYKISFTYNRTPRMFKESTLLSPLMNRG